MEVILNGLEKLSWERSVLSPALLERMEGVVGSLNENSVDHFRLIKHLWGRIDTFRIQGLIVFRVGTTSRPARIELVAVSETDPSLCLFPLTLPDSLSVFFDRIGIVDESSKNKFIEFFTPHAKRGKPK